MISGKTLTSTFTASLLALSSFGLSSASVGQPFTAAPLSYAENALEPIMSAKTISFHYGKHHKGYVENCNKLIPGTPFAGMTLEQIILASTDKPDQITIFNNAAQSWNHDFFWKSLRPASDAKLPDTLKKLLDQSFGSVDTFKAALFRAATTQFGSGWAWLVKDGDKLKVIKTANAENPMASGLVPLLTIDVWEHAYYLDYQNKRADYVKMIIDRLLNWDFALKNLSMKLPAKTETK
jgi:superoxide dismutase, Fe-Mn family